MSDLNNLMKQAKQMQERMEQMTRTLEQKIVIGESGGGMVTVKMTGLGEAKQINIDDSLHEGEDREMLPDLLVAAFNDARRKAEELKRTEVGGITAGLNLPTGF
jgi:DNA-binding YbaB/EbfC family protein